MLIGIDGNEANEVQKVGIGQFAHQLLTTIEKIDTQNSYLVYLKNPPNSDMPLSSTRWQYRVFGPKKMWTRFALPLKLLFQSEKLDCFFSPSHYTPLFCRFPLICSIMDLGFLHYPQQFTRKDLYQLTAWTKNSVVHSKHIVTISQFTKDEIISQYHKAENDITIAYPGAKIPSKINSEKPIQPFFLSLGTLKPSKNIPFLIRAFGQFSKDHPDYQLIIAGKKGWLFDDIYVVVKELRLEDKIVFQDYISEDQKWVLLQQASALIIPSLYEGFGFPAVEAMAVGTPVIASNVASLPEIVKGYGIIINPTNLNELTKAMVTIIEPKNYQKYHLLGIKRAAQFTWDKTAKSVINCFNKL